MGMLHAMASAATDRGQEGQLIALLEQLAWTLELLIDRDACAIGNGLTEAQGLPHTHGIGTAVERPWPLNSGADAVSVWQALGFGEAIPDGTRVAINQEFKSPRQLLQQGDELAFLPPISGG